MLVFFKANLAFLCVPKTGTTAYQTALRDHADILVTGPPGLKHMSVHRYDRFVRPMILTVCDSDPDVVAVMREPLSWLGSWWRYRQRPFLNGKPNSTRGIGFDDFVLAYMKEKKPGFANVGSQANFLKDKQNVTRKTHLFRYEDQARLREFLENRIGVVPLKLARENASPEGSVDLAPDVKRRFHRKFAHEFALYESIPIS